MPPSHGEYFRVSGVIVQEGDTTTHLPTTLQHGVVDVEDPRRWKQRGFWPVLLPELWILTNWNLPMPSADAVWVTETGSHAQALAGTVDTDNPSVGLSCSNLHS